MSQVDILKAIGSASLFSPWFRDRPTWQPWFAFLAALFALPMTPQQFETFQRCTGRTAPPTEPASEAWLVVGRRGRKSFVLALVAVFLACFRDYRPHLAPGERVTVLVCACDRRQARVIFRFIRGLITGIPLLKNLIERETSDTFDLSNSVTIEVGTASYRSTRGFSFAAVCADEIAFWPTEGSADPDYEILDAIRPGMATIPGAVLLCASSPYAKRGALYDAWRKHYAKDDDSVLVWQAPTRTMNSTVPQSVIDRAIERDAASATAEYLAEFRTDIAAFVAREIVDAAVDPGVFERGPVDGVHYHAFCDPSGGASDSMTVSVAHLEGKVLTLDAVREYRPPFSPEAVVGECAALLKRYRVTEVSGDRYAGEWPRERFREHGIAYRVSERVKSDVYRDALPELNSRNVALLDNPRLIAQLCGLERRTSRGGRDVIDHAPNRHDDLANAVCGSLLLAKLRPQPQDTMFIVQVDRGGGVIDSLSGEWMPPLASSAEAFR